MLSWFFLASGGKGAPVTVELLMEKPKIIGKELGREFNPKMGWLSWWESNEINAIKWKRKNGERAQVDVMAAEEWVKTKKIFEEYKPSSI